MQMRQKIIGIYQLGDEMIQLVLREGRGADLNPMPGDINFPRMKIGADKENIGCLIDSALHEAQEQTMSVLRKRFHRTDSYYVDSTSYLFVINHEEFTEVCHRAGLFLGRCLPDLIKAWRQWKQEERKLTTQR